MRQYQEHVEDLKPDGRHRKEVDRHHILHMVIEERLPGLRWRSPSAHHVFTRAGFADVDPEFQQFTMNLRSAPERIFAAHGADEFPHFFRNLLPSRPATPYLPCPEQPESLAMPSDDRRCLHDERSGFPVIPHNGEPDPQEPICWCQFGTLHGALQDSDLMAQSKNLQLKRSTASKRGRY